MKIITQVSICLFVVLTSLLALSSCSSNRSGASEGTQNKLGNTEQTRTTQEKFGLIMIDGRAYGALAVRFNRFSGEAWHCTETGQWTKVNEKEKVPTGNYQFETKGRVNPHGFTHHNDPGWDLFRIDTKSGKTWVATSENIWAEVKEPRS